MSQIAPEDLRIGFITKPSEPDLVVITDFKRGSYVGVYVLPSDKKSSLRHITPEMVWQHESYVVEPWDQDVLEDIREIHQIALQFIHVDLQRRRDMGDWTFATSDWNHTDPPNSHGVPALLERT